MRLFVSLEVPDGIRRGLDRLASGLEVGRVVPFENLHLTLAFLGDVPETKLMDLNTGLMEACGEAIELNIRGLDILGRGGKGALVALAQGEGLEALQRRVAGAVRAAGIDLQRRSFRPHVTLSRLPQNMGQKAQRQLGEFIALNSLATFGPETARDIALVRSHLREEGPIYQTLGQYPLMGTLPE